MTRPGTILRWHALRRILLREIHDSTRMLDMGGYDGYISYGLKRLLPGITAVVMDTDIQGVTIAHGRGTVGLCASAEHVPVANDRFSVVLCLDMIEHVEEVKGVFAEISRILCEGGKLVLTIPMSEGISFPFLNSSRGDRLQREWGHVRKGYCLAEIDGMLKAAGLVMESADRYLNFLSRLAYRVLVIPGRISQPKQRIFRLVARTECCIKWGAQEYIVVARKKRQHEIS